MKIKTSFYIENIMVIYEIYTTLYFTLVNYIDNFNHDAIYIVIWKSYLHYSVPSKYSSRFSSRFLLDYLYFSIFLFLKPHRSFHTLRHFQSSTHAILSPLSRGMF